MPSPRAALRHAVPIVLEGILGPLALFYCLLVFFGFRGALIGALVWSYGATFRRRRRGEEITALLLVGTVLLTVRTLIAFVTGSVFVYFVQPTAGTVIVAMVLLGSAATGRPFAQRFADDFCPLAPEFAARPRVQRFFVEISVMWAGVLLVNSALVLWMLESASVKAFVLERTAATWTLTSVAVVVSVIRFTSAMRRDDVTVHWGGTAGPAVTAPPAAVASLVA